MKKLCSVGILVLGLIAAGAAPAPAAGVAAAAVGGSLGKQLSRELADSVEKVMPSVVVVRTEETRYYRAYDMFYGRRYMIPEKLGGQGSGVFIDAAGHVLTSRHVVAGAQQIEVVLSDETAYSAKVVGMDANTDLAVLQVQKSGSARFTPIQLGDSDALRVGELVLAVGSPFALSGSVTMGVVSQKGRSIGALPFEDFIQTDATINPGNSGGPLVDLDGRMVGINAIIQTAGTQGSIGIGFAVPVNLARRVAESIMRSGTFERPWIGILPRETEADDSGRAPAGAGLVIGDIVRNAPAAKAGLRAGDTITEADGQKIRNIHDLQRTIMGRKIGDPLPITILRNGKPERRTIVSEKMPPVQEQQEDQ